MTDTIPHQRCVDGTLVCRKCGEPFGHDEQGFGSASTGWEHPFACPTEVTRLEAVAQAAWQLLEESGEHPTDLGLHVVSSADWQRTSAALDALEAHGWVPHGRRTE